MARQSKIGSTDIAGERGTLWPALAFAILTLVMIIMLALWPPQSGSVAAIYPADWTRQQLMASVAAADGRLIARSGRILLVSSDRRGLARRLWLSGARFVIHPLGLFGCGGRARPDAAPFSSAAAAPDAGGQPFPAI